MHLPPLLPPPPPPSPNSSTSSSPSLNHLYRLLFLPPFLPCHFPANTTTTISLPPPLSLLHHLYPTTTSLRPFHFPATSTPTPTSLPYPFSFPAPLPPPLPPSLPSSSRPPPPPPPFAGSQGPDASQRCRDYVKMFIHLPSAGVNERLDWDDLFCGRLATNVPAFHHSSTPNLVFEFHSDSFHSNSTGFKGQFRFLPKSKP